MAIPALPVPVLRAHQLFSPEPELVVAWQTSTDQSLLEAGGVDAATLVL